jgi:hypothetical protein
VLVVVDKRRDNLLREIALAYRERVDEMMGRLRVDVTISHAPDARLGGDPRVAGGALGREVIPTFTSIPSCWAGWCSGAHQIWTAPCAAAPADPRRRMMEAVPPGGRLGAQPAGRRFISRSRTMQTSTGGARRT